MVSFGRVNCHAFCVALWDELPGCRRFATFHTNCSLQHLALYAGAGARSCPGNTTHPTHSNSSFVACVATGDALFQTHENLEHLAMMERVLGPIPETLASKANKQAAKYFHRSRYVTVCVTDVW